MISNLTVMTVALIFMGAQTIFGVLAYRYGFNNGVDAAYVAPTLIEPEVTTSAPDHQLSA